MNVLYIYNTLVRIKIYECFVTHTQKKKKYTKESYRKNDYILATEQKHSIVVLIMIIYMHRGSMVFNILL